MWDELNETDRLKFPFDIKTLEWDQYFYDTLYGIKFYLLKEDHATADKDIERYKR